MPTTRARLTSRVDDAVTVLAAIRDQHPRPRVPERGTTDLRVLADQMATGRRGVLAAPNGLEAAGALQARRDRAGTPCLALGATLGREHRVLPATVKRSARSGPSGSGCRGRFTSWTLPARRPGVSPGCSTPRREGRSSRRQVYGCPFHSERFLAGAIICQRPLQPPSGFLPGGALVSLVAVLVAPSRRPPSRLCSNRVRR